MRSIRRSCLCRPRQSFASVDTSAIRENIKADIAQLVAGLNVHAVKMTPVDAPDIVYIELAVPQVLCQSRYPASGPKSKVISNS